MIRLKKQPLANQKISKRLFPGLLLALLTIVIGLGTSQTAFALPKKYNILYLRNIPVWDMHESAKFEHYLTDHLSQNVTAVTTKDFLDNRDHVLDDFNSYDLVVWHYTSPDTSDKKISRLITETQKPTVLIDGPGFPLSAQLGLIPSSTGKLAFPEEVRAARQEGFGSQWHPVLGGGEFDRIDVEKVLFPKQYIECAKERSPGGTIPTIEELQNLGEEEELFAPTTLKGYSQKYFSTKRGVSVVYPSWDWDRTGPYRYTRALMTTENENEIVALIDDRRGIIATGLIDLSGYDDGNPSALRLLHSMMLQILAPVASMTRLGQNVFTETDLVVPGRGFDFAVKRTYASGSKTRNGVLGRGFTLNHEQSIQWDKFNDRIYLSNGSGNQIPMDLVQGRGLTFPVAFSGGPSETRAMATFVAVNSDVTDIVVYYPAGNTAPETLENPIMNGPITAESCAKTRHYNGESTQSSSSSAPRRHLEGFLVRDSKGSKAFFAKDHSDSPFCWGPNGLTPFPNAMTRGGELEKFRLVYIEDTDGNRHSYYYRNQDGSESLESRRPEVIDALNPHETLSCVVDTEGRGFFFDYQYFNGGDFPLLTGIVTPDDLVDLTYTHEGLGHLIPPKVTIMHELSGSCPVSFPWQEPRCGHWRFKYQQWDTYLTKVTWTAPDGETSAKGFEYLTLSVPEEGADFPYLADPSFNYPLVGITDRSNQVIQRFEYENPTRDPEMQSPKITTPDRSFPRKYIVSETYYPGRLKKIISGIPGQQTVNEFYYHVNPGTPSLDDIRSRHAWVTTISNGIANTVAMNSRYQTVDRLEWYLPGRNVGRGYYQGPATTPGPCTAWDPQDVNFDPFAKCPGWLTHFEVNVDGQVTSEVAPSGITTKRRHLLDQAIVEPASLPWLTPAKPTNLDLKMLAFWKKYWHLRQYLSNEISVETTGANGVLKKRYDTVYEPVFNKPVEEYFQGARKHSYRYDYMGSSPQSGSPSAKYLALILGLKGITHAGSNPLWPDTLNGGSYAAHVFGANVPWLSGASAYLCSKPSGYNWGRAGHRICEIQPATEALGEIPAREPSAAKSAFDKYGRMVYHRSFGGYETKTQYGLSSDGSRITTTRQINREYPGETTSKQSYYDPRGLLLIEISSVNSDNIKYRIIRQVYDGFGRVVTSETSAKKTNNTQVVEKRQHTAYDVNGNAVKKVVERCPSGQCAGESAVGKEHWQLFSYDSQGRLVYDCSELKQEKNSVRMVCSSKAYLGSDVVREETVSGCVVPENIAIEPNDIAGAVENAVRAGNVEMTKHLIWDGRGQLSRETLVGNGNQSRIKQNVYDSAGNLIAEKDFENSWTLYERDGLGRMERTVFGALLGYLTDDQSTAEAVQRDVFGNVIRKTNGRPIPGTRNTDAAFGSIVYEYDARDTEIRSQTAQYELGQPSRVADTLTTSTIYDQDDRKLEQMTRTSSTETWTAFDYDGFGRLAEMYDGSNDTTVSYARDDLGRSVREVTRLGSSLSSVKPVELINQFSYDTQGRIVQSTQIDATGAQGNRVVFSEYDGLGHLVSTMDAKGQQTEYESDGQGNVRITRELFRDGDVAYFDGDDWQSYNEIEVEADYDDIGRLMVRRDALGNEVQFAYNGFGELAVLMRPNGRTDNGSGATFSKAFTRNKNGVITRIAMSDGRDIAMELDRYGRTTKLLEDREVAQEFEYYGNGSLARASDYNRGNPEVTQVAVVRSYDTLGNLLLDETQITDKMGTSVANATLAGYSGAHLVSLKLPSTTDAQKIDYIYADKNPGWLMHVAVGGEKYASYEWAGSSLLRKAVYLPETQLITQRYTKEWSAYDGFGNLEAQLIYVGDGDKVQAVVADASYGYNENNRLIKENDSADPSRDVAYNLDALDRVFEVEGKTEAKKFALDEANNIRQHYDMASGADTQMVISRNGLNQVLRIEREGKVINGFDYDDAGRMIGDEMRKLTWDDQDRLVEVRDAQGLQARYAYDALGRRVRKQISGKTNETVDYHLFGEDVVEERHEVTVDSEKEEMEETLLVIVHDPTAIDRYLGFETYVNEGGRWELAKRRFPAIDIRNNVVATLDENGKLAEEYHYGLYGDEPNPNYEEYIPYRFAGRKYDEETGLYYNRTRYYSPELARFISVDSIGIWGDLNNYGNGYAYVGNMANAFGDPAGMEEDALQEQTKGQISFLKIGIPAMGFLASCTASASPITAGIVGAGTIVASWLLGEVESAANAEDQKRIEKNMNDRIAAIERANSEQLQSMEKRINAIEMSKSKVEKVQDSEGNIYFTIDVDGDGKKDITTKDENYARQYSQKIDESKNDNDDGERTNVIQLDEVCVTCEDDGDTTGNDKPGGGERPTPDGDGGTSPDEIIASMIRQMRRSPGPDPKPTPNPQDIADAIRTGGIKYMLARYARGQGLSTHDKPGVAVDEWGNLVVAPRFINRVTGPGARTLEEGIGMLLTINPNRGGAIDPAPIPLTPLALPETFNPGGVPGKDVVQNPVETVVNPALRDTANTTSIRTAQ